MLDPDGARWWAYRTWPVIACVWYILKIQILKPLTGTWNIISTQLMIALIMVTITGYKLSIVGIWQRYCLLLIPTQGFFLYLVSWV